MQPPWAPGPLPPPRSAADQRIVAGGVLAFCGFLIQGILGFLVFFSRENFPFGFFAAFNVVSGIGNVLIGVGLLLAFLGLASRPR